jgi:hypothetical protein
MCQGEFPDGVRACLVGLTGVHPRGIDFLVLSRLMSWKPKPNSDNFAGGVLVKTKHCERMIAWLDGYERSLRTGVTIT